MRSAAVFQGRDGRLETEHAPLDNVSESRRSEARLRGAAVENLCLAVADLGVQGQHGGIQIGVGTRLQLEVPEGVGAPHQGRAVARSARLPDPRGYVTD